MAQFAPVQLASKQKGFLPVSRATAWNPIQSGAFPPVRRFPSSQEVSLIPLKPISKFYERLNTARLLLISFLFDVLDENTAIFSFDRRSKSVTSKGTDTFFPFHCEACLDSGFRQHLHGALLTDEAASADSLVAAPAYLARPPYLCHPDI